MKNICPVCGYPELNTAPFYNGDPLNSPSMDFCSCCAFQFGVTDLDKHFTYEQWREKWIADGMPWRGLGQKPPKNWDPRAQLLYADKRFDEAHETEIQKIIAERQKHRPN